MAERREASPRRLRGVRRRRGVAAGVVAGVLLAAGLLLAGALGNARSVKVVHVVVTSSRPPTNPTVATPGPRSLPPASAGSNGSFTPPSTSDSLLPADARASFARLRASLPGAVDVSLAPLGSGSLVLLGDDTPAHGWSTAKVPVLVALLRARGDRGLTPTENAWAQLAITQSDNQSILALFGDLERLKGGLAGASDFIQQLFRQSGDARTIVATAPPPPGAATTFGQTEWMPSDAVKFFSALGRGCLLPSSQTDYILHLMQNIASSESWGLGSAGFNVPVAFKGGWGPEPSGTYLVRQSGIIDPGSSRGVAVSIVAYPTPRGDSFGTGTQILTQTAQWLRHELRLQSRSTVGCAPG